MSAAHTKTKTGRNRLILVLALAAILASSCVLKEGEGYVVQPAPPNGVHLTISAGFTEELQLASDVVAQGVNIDAVLRDRNIDTTCPNLGDRTRGDRCAFRILGAVDIEGFGSGIFENGYWNNAVSGKEFDDFRNDGMAKTRNTGCLHVTMKRVQISVFYETEDANWTYRTKADSHC